MATINTEEAKKAIAKAKEHANISKTLKFNKGINHDAELALDRKAIAMILNHLGISLPEFEEYNRKANEAKSEVKGR